MEIVSIHDVFSHYIDKKYDEAYDAVTKNKHGRFGLLVEYDDAGNQRKVGEYQFEDENIWYSFDDDDEQIEE